MFIDYKLIDAYLEYSQDRIKASVRLGGTRFYLANWMAIPPPIMQQFTRNHGRKILQSIRFRRRGVGQKKLRESQVEINTEINEATGEGEEKRRSSPSESLY